jgi:hypothetical protein
MNWTFNDLTWEYLTTRLCFDKKTLSQKLAKKHALDKKIVDTKINSLYGKKNDLLEAEILLIRQQNTDNLFKNNKLKKLRNFRTSLLD